MNRHFSHLWGSALVLSLWLASVGSLQSQGTDPFQKATPVYSTQFETGLDKGLILHGTGPDTFQLVEGIGDPPRKALKVTVSRDEDFSRVANGVPRAEVSFAPRFRLSADKDYWIEWWIFLPQDYVFDSQQPEGLSQIHQGPNQGTPPFSLSLVGGHYQVDLRSGGSHPVEHFDLGAAGDDRGHWVRWRLHYRGNAEGKGSVLQLYHGDDLKLDQSGQPNAYPGDDQAYFKFGLYKWWWKTKPSDVTERNLYFGDLRVSAP